MVVIDTEARIENYVQSEKDNGISQLRRVPEVRGVELLPAISLIRSKAYVPERKLTPRLLKGHIDPQDW